MEESWQPGFSSESLTGFSFKSVTGFNSKSGTGFSPKSLTGLSSKSVTDFISKPVTDLISKPVTGFVSKPASRVPQEEGGRVLGCTQGFHPRLPCRAGSAPALGSLRDAADAGGLQEGGENPARYGKQGILFQMGLGEGGRWGGRMKHAPGSVLFRFEVFKLQILMRKIVSSIQNSA